MSRPKCPGCGADNGLDVRPSVHGPGWWKSLLCGRRWQVDPHGDKRDAIETACQGYEDRQHSNPQTASPTDADIDRFIDHATFWPYA